jgi:hypothetical protein
MWMLNEEEDYCTSVPAFTYCTRDNFILSRPCDCSGSKAEPDGWRRAAPSALHLLSVLMADQFAAWAQCFEWMRSLGFVGQVARCAAIGMRAMYQLIGRHRGQARARAKLCSRFVLRLRGALCWTGACSKIEIAGGLDFGVNISGSKAEPDGWRRAAPSALHLLSVLMADQFAAWAQCFEWMRSLTTLLKCCTPISACQ